MMRVTGRAGCTLRNVVCRYPNRVSPDAFQLVRFQVKYTRARAWTYLPGAPLS